MSLMSNMHCLSCLLLRKSDSVNSSQASASADQHETEAPCEQGYSWSISSGAGCWNCMQCRPPQTWRSLHCSLSSSELRRSFLVALLVAQISAPSLAQQRRPTQSSWRRSARQALCAQMHFCHHICYASTSCTLMAIPTIVYGVVRSKWEPHSIIMDADLGRSSSKGPGRGRRRTESGEGSSARL